MLLLLFTITLHRNLNTTEDSSSFPRQLRLSFRLAYVDILIAKDCATGDAGRRLRIARYVRVPGGHILSHHLVVERKDTVLRNVSAVRQLTDPERRIDEAEAVGRHVEDVVDLLRNTLLLATVTAFGDEAFDPPVEAGEVAAHLVADPIGVDVEAREVEEGVDARFQIHGKAKGVLERFLPLFGLAVFLFAAFGLGASTGDVCLIEVRFAECDGTGTVQFESFSERAGGPLTFILRPLVINPNDVKPNPETDPEVTLWKSNVDASFGPDGDVVVDFGGLNGQVCFQYLDDGVEVGGVNGAPIFAPHYIDLEFGPDWNCRLKPRQSPT